MNQVYPGASREILEVFCLLAEEVEYFDLAQHPICRRQFFAGADALDKRVVGDASSSDDGYFHNIST